MYIPTALLAALILPSSMPAPVCTGTATSLAPAPTWSRRPQLATPPPARATSWTPSAAAALLPRSPKKSLTPSTTPRRPGASPKPKPKPKQYADGTTPDMVPEFAHEEAAEAAAADKEEADAEKLGADPERTEVGATMFNEGARRKRDSTLRAGPALDGEERRVHRPLSVVRQARYEGLPGQRWDRVGAVLGVAVVVWVFMMVWEGLRALYRGE